jgi:hypothetical protein
MKRLILIIVPLLLCAPLRARAADPSPKAAEADPVAQARSHFNRGVKLYSEDDFRAALIEFTRANELAPNWAVLYNIGQSYYQLRDYPNALGTLEKYLGQGNTSIPGDRRTQVETEIVELRGRVAHITITSNAEGAEIAVDDVVLGKTPLSSPQLVGAGRHTFRATKPGTPPVTKVVDIAGGDNLTVALSFVEAPRTIVPVVVVRRRSYTPAIASLAVGGAGIITGTVFGILAITDKSSLKGECQGTTCPITAQGDISAFNRNGAISTVGFAVGGAGLATAVVLYLMQGGKEATTAPPPVSSTLRIKPWLSLTSAGVTGTF